MREGTPFQTISKDVPNDVIHLPSALNDVIPLLSALNDVIQLPKYCGRSNDKGGSILGDSKVKFRKKEQ